MDVSSSIRDPLTSLSLSLSGLDLHENSGPACRICSRIVCSSYGCSNITTATTISSCITASSDDSARETEMGLEKEMFNPKFLGVMQKMIRKEVRSYMFGIEKNEACFHAEDIRNVVVKRIEISRIE
ncbi:hypothetical protein LINPERHAP2_LOCUS25296 [Linum perenne]